ncbi:MAG: hydroxymethylglutaryl-CoA lyase [Pseudomonadota bacterium]
MSAQTVAIVEVSPRDGIQNERTILSTDDKRTLITMAARAGLSRMEVTSFVNPARVPQMADAQDVAQNLPPEVADGAIGLVLNRKGFDRALKTPLKEVNVVVVASDTFSQKNQGCTTDEGVAAFAAIRAAAPAHVRVGVTIAAAFGCPFEGEVSPKRLAEVVEACAAQNPHELALADTIGVGTPRDVTERVAIAAKTGLPVRLHLHNTRGTGLANAWAGLEAGVTALDASLGGTGGCPFAPRATGNIATEDLVYMLERAGIPTGVDLDAAIIAAEWLEARLGITAPGQVMRAGPFPARAA